MKISRIDNLGRIVIPISYRKMLAITPEKDLIIEMDGNNVIIHTKDNTCRLCGAAAHNTVFLLCKKCISKIKALDE